MGEKREKEGHGREGKKLKKNSNAKINRHM